MRGETSAPPASGFLVHWKEIVIVQVFCTVARNCFFIHYNREFIIRKRGKFGCCSSGGILRGGLLRGPGGRGRRRWCFPGARRRGWRGDRQIWVQGGTRRRRQREERRILWDFSGPPFCCVRVWRNAVFESVTMPYLNLLQYRIETYYNKEGIGYEITAGGYA